MTVENKIKSYKVNGEKTTVGQKDVDLIVRNVWNEQNMIELEFQGKKIEIHSQDLIKAIHNSIMNER